MIAVRPRRGALIAGLLTAAFASAPLRAQQRSQWTLDPSLYIFIPGLAGTVGIGNIDVDLSSPSNVLLNINFAFMGNVRVGYGDWAFTADVFYGDVGATKNRLSGSVKELIVEPTFSPVTEICRSASSRVVRARSCLRHRRNLD